MAVITKQLALAIAAKLKASITSRPDKPHDMACVYHEGRLVAQFGIRRGSEKELGHDHVPSQIYLGPHKARLLGQCPMSRDEWVSILKGKGLL